MARTNDPPATDRRRPAGAVAARLLFTVAGGLLVWTWAAPPASARQVTVAPARRVDRSVDVQPAAAVAVAPAARVSGNVANTD